MSFIKQILRPQIEASNIFIGRNNELRFFVQHILKPKQPTYNIVSISGNPGVGKSTLLSRFRDKASKVRFKNSCVTALVDARQLHTSWSNVPLNCEGQAFHSLHLRMPWLPTRNLCSIGKTSKKLHETLFRASSQILLVQGSWVSK